MKVRALIADSYYLSGIVSRGAEGVSGSQTSDGLRLLNALLSILSKSGKYITYNSEGNITCVPGQEKYDVNNLIDLNVLTFNSGTLRFPLTRDSEYQYFGTGRVDDIKTLPYQYYAERQKGKTIIYLYFIPDKNYTLNIRGKYALGSVTLDQELDNTLEQFFQTFLTYKLAEYLANENGISLTDGIKKTLNDLENLNKDVTGKDLSIQKKSMFSNGSIRNYAYANLGRGFTPS